MVAELTTIRPAEHLPLLNAIAAAYPIELAEIEVVPSIRDWCAARGLAEANLFRSGMTVRDGATGRMLILLADAITPAMQTSAIGALDARGYIDDTEPLWQDSQAFLLHLLLHELAHAQFPQATYEVEHSFFKEFQS